MARGTTLGLPVLVQTGHDDDVATVGVKEQRLGPPATPDADLPSWSYGHLVSDSTRPAMRGEQR
jgi:hypothetical protein